MAKLLTGRGDLKGERNKTTEVGKEIDEVTSFGSFIDEFVMRSCERRKGDCLRVEKGERLGKKAISWGLRSIIP